MGALRKPPPVQGSGFENGASVEAAWADRTVANIATNLDHLTASHWSPRRINALVQCRLRTAPAQSADVVQGVSQRHQRSRALARVPLEVRAEAVARHTQAPRCAQVLVDLLDLNCCQKLTLIDE